MSKEKNNFFIETIKSIKDLDKYEDFAVEKPSKAFKYLLKIVVFFSIIISLFYTFNITKSMSNIYEKVRNNLPEFSYSQGILDMDSEEPIILEDYKDTFGKIIIDTNIKSDEINKYDKEIREGQIGILVLKDKCIILSNNALGQVTYKYEDLAKNYNIKEFTKQNIIDYIDNMNIVTIYGSIYFIMFVYLFIAYFISIFIDVLILSILAFITSRLTNIKLKYAPSFNVAIHSITLPVILNLIYIIVNLLTGFRIKYFGLMYSTISYIYVIVAILMIKTDFINRQMELIKLAQEQEKVRNEMREKEENKKEDQKKEDKKPEKDEKKDKEPTKRKKKSDEEKGVGADAPACHESGK